MDAACLQHLVTEEEKTAFERDGYLIVPKAIWWQSLSPSRIASISRNASAWG
jgi:hypothetical protein